MQNRPPRADGGEQELNTIQTLCDTGFQVIIYGGRDDPAARKAAGFTEGSAVVILDREAEVEIHRRKIALMATGVEEDEAFASFVSRFVSRNMADIYELRILNGHHPDSFLSATAATIAERGDYLD